MHAQIGYSAVSTPSTNTDSAKRKVISKEKMRAMLRAKLARGRDGRMRRGESERRFLESLVQQDLKCLICYQIMLNPYQLRCGHAYCYQCLEQLSEHQEYANACPICRLPIASNPTHCSTLNQLILAFVGLRFSLRRIKELLERCYQLSRVVHYRALVVVRLPVGSLVECRITNRWFLGKILGIQQQGSGRKMVRVVLKFKGLEGQREYFGQGSYLERTCGYSPTQLAPYRTFTKPDLNVVHELKALSSDQFVDFEESSQESEAETEQMEVQTEEIDI